MNQQRIKELWDEANSRYYQSESDQPLPQFIFAELIWQAAYEEGHDVGVDAGFEAGRNASFTEQHFGVDE